jgi:hypothetical protein
MKFVFFLLLIFFLASCSESNTQSQTLVEAHQIHLECLDLEEKLKTSILHLDSVALNKNDVVIKTKVDSLKGLLDEWHNNLIEVPGFEHEHHNHEHHEHKPIPKMTDASMLEYQKNSKLAIEDLTKSAIGLSKSIK